MSRHRDIRNLDIEAVLEEDDYYEEEGIPEMTPQQAVQMKNATNEIYAVLGEDCSIPKDKIEETLWYYYFDVPQTVDYLLKQLTTQKPKGTAKKEKKATKPKLTLQDLLNNDAASKVGLTKVPSKGTISLGALAANAKLTNSTSRPSLASLAKGVDSLTLGSKASVNLKGQLPLAEPRCNGNFRNLNLKALEKNASLSSIAKLGSTKKLVEEAVIDSTEPLAIPFKEKEPLESKSLSHPLLTAPSLFAFALCSPTEEPRPFPPSQLLATPDSFTLSSLILESSNQSVKPSRFDSPSPDDLVRQAQSNAGSKRTSTVDQATLDLEGMNLGLKPKAEATPPSSPLRRIDVVAEHRLRSAGLANLNLVVVGHVDAGKSTLMGHLLYQAGVVDSRTIQKFERDSEKLGKKSFAFAWVLDETSDERERGITVDVATTQFQTPRHHVTVLDAPGHRDFIPNMISGASQADVAILVVDSTPGEFESGFARGGQTKEHALLIRSLGVRQVAIAVNKLDVCDWDEARFASIKAELGDFLSSAGFYPNCITFVPVSGLKGENLFTPVDASHPLRNWYAGPSLLEVVDSFDPLIRPIEGALRFPVADFFKGGIGSSGGVSVSGRILQGNVQLGDVLAILPGDETGVVKAIEANNNTALWAAAGDSVVMTISGLDILQLRPGSILCLPQFPVPVSNCFLAQVLIFDPAVPVTNGYPVILHHQSFNTSAYITSLVALLDKTTGKPIKKNPRHLPKNCTATIKITVEAPLCLEAFSSCKDLGRFALRRAGATIATGIIVEVLPIV